MATGFAFLVGAGLMLLAGLLAALTAARIEIDAKAIRVLHGRWPFLRTRTIPISSVRSISFGSGDARYVEVAVEGGTTYWIVPGTSSGTEETKWLAAEVNRAVERFRTAPTPERPVREGHYLRLYWASFQAPFSRTNGMARVVDEALTMPGSETFCSTVTTLSVATSSPSTIGTPAVRMADARSARFGTVF